MSGPPAGIRSSRSRWRPLVLLTAAHAVGTIGFTSVLAMGPAVQAALGLSRTEFGLLATAYYAGLLGCAFPSGWVVDRVGVRRALICAHVIMALGTALLARAPGLPAAAAAAGLSGVGYALVNPSTAKGILLWFPARERATAMGIKQTGVPIGGAAAAGIGAAAAAVGWQELLWTVAAATGAAAGLYLALGDGPGEERDAKARGGPGDLLEVLRNRNLMVLNLTGSLFSAVQTAFFTYLTLFIQDATRAGLAVASLCLGFAHAGSAAGRIGWGLASDRLLGGRRKVALVYIGAAASAFLAAMAGLRPGWGPVLGALLAFLLGTTIASHAGLYQAGAVEAVDARMAGAAIGYSMTATPLGAMIGPPLFGSLVDRTGWYGSGWLLVAGALLAGTLLFARAFRERQPGCVAA